MTGSQATNTDSRSTGSQLLSKVPEITVFFWIIKVLATTVGETFADYINATLGFGLTLTTIVMSAATLGVLFVQFRNRRYVPGVYWLAVTLISVAGTLITDNLTDAANLPLSASTTIFAIALIATFIAWYRSEHTLSIHSVVTRRRETFYWLTILFTFALGTAAGDWTAEGLGLGFFASALIYAGLIALVATIHFGLQTGSGDEKRKATNAVWAFWVAYILTRPLGASLGDLLSQDTDAGGLGLGTTVTSGIFLAAILAVVTYLTRSKKDQIPEAKIS